MSAKLYKKIGEVQQLFDAVEDSTKSLEELLAKLKPLLYERGLVITFDSLIIDGCIRVTCTITDISDDKNDRINTLAFESCTINKGNDNITECTRNAMRCALGMVLCIGVKEMHSYGTRCPRALGSGGSRSTVCFVSI